ncbi:MAG: AraC family transcriptional regulator [Sphingobacteriales bacterium]|nr:MAG: AraC family transcriptional regulator [Sphingobacteriales bacterium]
MMQTLTNISVEGSQIVGNDAAKTLLKELNVVKQPAGLVDVLDRFFMSKLPIANGTEDVRKVLEFIHLRRGNLSVKEMEIVCAVHRKKTERHFQKKIGIGPKNYASIYRFKCLMKYLEEHPGITWQELSLSTGFYDQSHMVRYFKEYLRVPPNQLFTLDVNFINYLFNR